MLSLVFHSSLLMVKGINLVITHDGFLCVSVFFIVATLVTEVLFKQTLIRTTV